MLNPKLFGSKNPVRPDPSILLRTEGIVEGLWVSGWWFDQLTTNG